ncbi:hypothetical protein KAR91_63795 [Candidatus Pacearchaeota archaeon]|nr:hypothetical protein [Candidatus Pacearchaeota archaeon]
MMKCKELIEKLNRLDGELELVVRGMDCLGGISDVYLDYSHTDDSPFVAIDVDDTD